LIEFFGEIESWIRLYGNFVERPQEYMPFEEIARQMCEPHAYSGEYETSRELETPGNNEQEKCATEEHDQRVSNASTG